jgi:hypothetical protein
MTAPALAFGTTKIVFASKFIPKITSSIDPTFKPGAATATTYISNRVNSSTPTTLFSGTEHRLGDFSESAKWSTEHVVLGCYD